MASNNYKGNCHCGANRFELACPEITNAIEYLQITRGNEQTYFTYKSAAVECDICSHCGTLFRGQHTSGPLRGKTGMNLRTILDLNPWKLPTTLSDGKAEENPPFVRSAFTGTIPAFEGDRLQTYTGSCHCGKIQIAVKVPPLASGDIEIKEDNCSICVRLAQTQIYPDKDQVRIAGRENSTEYIHGRRFGSNPFCSTCGSNVYGTLYGPPREVVNRMPEAKKAFVEKTLRIQPLNIRMLDGVDWNEIRVEKSDEGTAGYVLAD